MAVLLAAVLSLTVGVVLGMLGGGGAILTLPMLVYVVGVEAKPAIAMSLFVVGSTSLVGGAMHARAANVQWRIAMVFGAAAMAGAFAGGRIAHFVPSAVLLVLFALVMLVTATAMLRGRKEGLGGEPRVALGKVLGLGAAVGVLSGLVGAGGGFLIVPALSIFGGLAMRHAIGTSLVVIALQSFAGFAGHIAHVSLDWTLAGIVTACAVAGTFAGVALGKRISPDALRRGFAWLVLGMGIFMIGKEASLVVTALVAAVTLAVVWLVTKAAHVRAA